MKTLFSLAICTLLILGNVFAQKVEDELSTLLKEKRYRELVNKVCSLRENQYFKNAFMDYCLAYGYCQLNKPTLSGKWFNHILNSYNSLSENKRKELIKLKQSCTNTNTSVLSTNAMFEFLRSMNSEGVEALYAGIESKMGLPNLTDTVKSLDFENLTFDSQNRKFTLKQKREALAYYNNLLKGQSLKFDTTAHFLVFYPNNALAIKNHMNRLEEYYSFYNLTFNLNQSNRLIIVFYCTNRIDFNKVAQLVHNIPVPNSTFGYASSIDLIMMGIANAAWLGAMKHELFHLMIRSFIGDIPPWLDEGTACYFESSNLYNNITRTNFKRTNYRVNLLHQTDHLKFTIKDKFLIPSIKQLTNYNWQEFSGISGDLVIKNSFNQALSYAFVTYLSEKNLLSKTIDAFRNRSYTEVPLNGKNDELIILHLRTNDELLKNVTGMNHEELQLDFDQWCKVQNIYLN